MSDDLNRREFMQKTAAIGAGLYVGGRAQGEESTKPDVINVALLGVGSQGRTLMDAIIKMKSPGIRLVAVCDIWDVNRGQVKRRMKRYEKYYGYR